MQEVDVESTSDSDKRPSLKIRGGFVLAGSIHQIASPALSSECSNASAHPRLASGLAGLGCGATLTTTASPSAARARSAANRPIPEHVPRPERADDARKGSVARFVQRCAFGGRQLVGSTIPSRRLHEAERTIVPDEEMFEEARGLPEPAPCPAPKPAPAHLAARAVEAGNGPLRMFDPRSLDFSPYPEPAADELDVAEGHTGLRHPEGAGVHPEHQDPGRARAVACEIRAMRRPAYSSGL